MKKIMNILCSTDKNFLNPTYVFMTSVMENHKDIEVHFYLLAGEDITKNDKEQLKKYIISMGHKIEFVSVNSSVYDNYIVHEKFPRSAYYRLLAHEYLPKSVHRILYLDVDIVVDKNIYDDFYQLDFEDKYLIVTSHNPNPNYCNMLDKTIVNLEAAAKGEYFNSGVLLMNLDKFRENITLDDYNQAYKKCEKMGFEIFYDQGLLNFMFYDKSKYLSSMDYNFRFSIPMQYKNKLEKDTVYKKSIIHFTGLNQPYKPWDIRWDDEMLKTFGNVPFNSKYFYVSSELNDLCEIWWKYAEKTPVFDEIDFQMKIKLKWFKRNLMDFMLEHNNFVKNSSNSSKNIQIKNGKSNQVVAELPENFHYRAYKLGCIIVSPFLALKKLFKKK